MSFIQSLMPSPRSQEESDSDLEQAVCHINVDGKKYEFLSEAFAEAIKNNGLLFFRWQNSRLNPYISCGKEKRIEPALACFIDLSEMLVYQLLRTNTAPAEICRPLIDTCCTVFFRIMKMRPVYQELSFFEKHKFSFKTKEYNKHLEESFTGLITLFHQRIIENKEWNGLKKSVDEAFVEHHKNLPFAIKCLAYIFDPDKSARFSRLSKERDSLLSPCKKIFFTAAATTVLGIVILGQIHSTNP